MDPRPAWQRAIEWMKEWMGKPSFKVAEAVGAAAAGIVTFVVSGDWGPAGVALALGAVVVFIVAFVGRWVSTPLRDLRELRSSVAGREAHLRQESEDRREREAQFHAYVDRQLERLRAMKDSHGPGWTTFEWREFAALAWRTADGIGSMDQRMGQYVEITLRSVDNDIAEYHAPLATSADEIIDTIEETKDLYRP